MHPIEKGDISVAMLTAAFLRRQYVVLKPISERHRYDLVIDRGSGFERIQCKTGRLRDGAVHFNTCSSMYHHGKSRQDYRGQIELFGVYCPDNDACYLVPVDAVGKTEGYLRVEPTKNRQATRIRMAADYSISLPSKHCGDAAHL